MSTIPKAPPFDPELDTVLQNVSIPATLTAEMVDTSRNFGPTEAATQATLAAHGIKREDYSIPGFGSDPITVSVLSRVSHAGLGPGVLYTHGGGMVSGNRFVGLGQLIPWITDHDVVAVSVEYRLAPECPDPYPVEDCYAGLVWTASHASEIGIDGDRLFIAGASAGGGLAAGTALLARDRRGPRLIGQVLTCPMLDYRDATVSTQQIDGVGIWDRGSNKLGWTSLLGDRRGSTDVSIYAAPARTNDFSELPPAFIDAGSAEVFRDEAVAFASGIWAAGGEAELHIWAGGFHGFESIAPNAAVSQASSHARNNWVARLLGSH